MRVAYVAPEIPGLSSTFVYKEILELEKLGHDVIPFTIHPNPFDSECRKLKNLKERAKGLYSRSVLTLLVDNLMSISNSPLRYLSCLMLCLGDMRANSRKPRIAFGILYRFIVAGSLAKDVQEEGVQHLHAHFAHFPTDIVMYAGAITGVPYSFTAHANDIFCNFWLLKEKVDRAKFVATISRYNIDYLTNIGCNGKKIHLIRCGIDVLDYPASLARTAAVGRLKLGFLGRLVEKKGVDVLLAACSILKERKIDFQMEINGDGPLMADLVALQEELELTDVVSFKGKITNDKVFSWLSSIDVFVLPAKKDRGGDMDGIPVALMEAMLCKVTVISTYLSGIPELIRNEETGLLAEPGDPISLADCILNIVNNPALLDGLSSSAYDYVLSEFDLGKNVVKLSRLFNDVC